MSLPVVRSQVRNRVAAPDMERPAAELARAIQDAMVALFNLQTALINFFANKTSKGLIEAFQVTRDILRADWEKYILFFQGCQGYSEDYISLCQYSATRKAPETLVFARDVLGMAKNLSREVSVLKTKHEKALNDLGRHSKKLPPAFRKQISRGGPDTLVAKPGTSGTLQFIQIANASLRPDGAQALKASNEALAVIDTSLRDLNVFWRDQVDQLASASKPGSTFRLTKEELRRAEEMWKRYQSVLQRVISSISASSDAVQVDPVGAPQPRGATGGRKGGGSFWSKFFRFFFG